MQADVSRRVVALSAESKRLADRADLSQDDRTRTLTERRAVYFWLMTQAVVERLLAWQWLLGTGLLVHLRRCRMRQAGYGCKMLPIGTRMGELAVVQV